MNPSVLYPLIEARRHRPRRTLAVHRQVRRYPRSSLPAIRLVVGPPVDTAIPRDAECRVGIRRTVTISGIDRVGGRERVQHPRYGTTELDSETQRHTPCTERHVQPAAQSAGRDGVGELRIAIRLGGENLPMANMASGFIALVGARRSATSCIRSASAAPPTAIDRRRIVALHRPGRLAELASVANEFGSARRAHVTPTSSKPSRQ